VTSAMLYVHELRFQFEETFVGVAVNKQGHEPMQKQGLYENGVITLHVIFAERHSTSSSL